MAEDKDKVKVILEVGVNDKGQVTVSGPINNKGMCIDLLSQAITIINGLKPPPKSPIIKPGPGGMMPS